MDDPRNPSFRLMAASLALQATIAKYGPGPVAAKEAVRSADLLIVELVTTPALPIAQEEKKL